MSKEVYVKGAFIGKPSLVTEERVYIDTDTDSWTSAFGKCLLMGLGLNKGSGLNLTSSVSDTEFNKIKDACSMFGVEVRRPIKVGARNTDLVDHAFDEEELSPMKSPRSRVGCRVGAHKRVGSNGNSVVDHGEEIPTKPRLRRVIRLSEYSPATSRGYTHGTYDIEKEEDLNNLTVCELREVAANLGITYSGLKKADLISKIKEAQGKELV